jgi:hypothetical protein
MVNEIIKRFESYGYVVEKQQIPNVLNYYSQIDLLPEDRQDKENLRLSFFYQNKYSTKNFIIYENDSIYSNGVSYEEEGVKYYYYSFGTKISRVYGFNELDKLSNDCYHEMINYFTSEQISDIRNIKLTNMLSE